MLSVHITAASGVVPSTELADGIARLRASGLTVTADPKLDEPYFVFSGSDAERADRFWAAAWNPTTEIIWCARGGYGAARILPELERRTLADGTPPRKLLCGFSDVTALHEFVRSRWGWSTLHCAMPGAASFTSLSDSDYFATFSYLHRKSVTPGWSNITLSSLGIEPLIDLTGTLVGGNLTVLASLAGTPFAPDNLGGRLLFLEDVSEAPYRLDRSLQQLYHAGCLRGVRAILLGTFHNCIDTPPTTADNLPIRPTLDERTWMKHVFAEFSRATHIPVLHTLPIGHGPEKAPLPLGAKYTITGSGQLRLDHWDWLG